jgi:hypothetical protein
MTPQIFIDIFTNSSIDYQDRFSRFCDQFHESRSSFPSTYANDLKLVNNGNDDLLVAMAEVLSDIAFSKQK